MVRFQIKIASLAIGSKRFANLLTFTWEVVLKANSHTVIFRVCKYAINETDDVLSATKRSAMRVSVIISLNFAFCTHSTDENR